MVLNKSTEKTTANTHSAGKWTLTLLPISQQGQNLPQKCQTTHSALSCRLILTKWSFILMLHFQWDGLRNCL